MNFDGFFIYLIFEFRYLFKIRNSKFKINLIGVRILCDDQECEVQ